MQQTNVPLSWVAPMLGRTVQQGEGRVSCQTKILENPQAGTVTIDEAWEMDRTVPFTLVDCGNSQYDPGTASRLLLIQLPTGHLRTLPVALIKDKHYGYRLKNGYWAIRPWRLQGARIDLRPMSSNALTESTYKASPTVMGRWVDIPDAELNQDSIRQYLENAAQINLLTEGVIVDVLS